MQDQSPEDEFRRRRRRERNKVAAEKCRNKKKKETMNLFSEREVVERANVCYKEEIAKLEAEQRQLMHLLANHQPLCQLGTNTCFAKSKSYSSSHIHYTAMEEDINEDPEDVVMTVNDYSQMENGDQRSEYLSQSCTRSSTREENATSYTNLAYPGYSFTSGYYDSACAAV